MGMTRREFLKTGGSAIAGAALGTVYGKNSNENAENALAKIVSYEIQRMFDINGATTSKKKGEVLEKYYQERYHLDPLDMEANRLKFQEELLRAVDVRTDHGQTWKRDVPEYDTGFGIKSTEFNTLMAAYKSNGLLDDVHRNIERIKRITDKGAKEAFLQLDVAVKKKMYEK